MVAYSASSGDRPLGPALRRAWVGYQRLLDTEMVEAGFGERRFPDGRVLRRCSAGGVTTSQLGRELGITRQGAAKIVVGLRERGYVTIRASETSDREKLVELTPRAVAYLDALQRATGSVTDRLRRQLGAEGFDALHQLLEALGGDENPRMRDDIASRLIASEVPDV